MQRLQHTASPGARTAERSSVRAFSAATQRRAPVTCHAHQQPQPYQQPGTSPAAQQSRRHALLSVLSAPAVAMLMGAAPACAMAPPPDGYRLQLDKLDGYSFIYPDNWLVVTSSGNDIFLRNPRSVEENLFVGITSPSSSRFKTVEDLGSPKEAAMRMLDQFLTKEFMSTRLGIARYGEIVSASARTADDGKQYYDIAIRMTSYGSRNPYVASREEVLKDYGLEWDRTLSTVLGVSNQRLYELRLQTSTAQYDKRKDDLRTIMESFRVREVEQQ